MLSLGALAISGNASAVPSLLDSSVTNNMLSALGLLALGGNGTFSPNLQSSQVGRWVCVWEFCFLCSCCHGVVVLYGRPPCGLVLRCGVAWCVA